MNQQGQNPRQFLLVVGLTLAISTNVARGQMPDIEFTVESVKPEFLPFEFIHFKATVTNRGKMAVTVPEPSERAAKQIKGVSKSKGSSANQRGQESLICRCRLVSLPQCHAHHELMKQGGCTTP